MFGRRNQQPGPVVRMLQNADPAVRLKAVHILGGRHRPRAAWLLRRTFRDDPNPRVRAAADVYLAEWGRVMLQQLNAVPNNNNGGKIAPQDQLWECEFCGTKDVKGGVCPNCGAPRPDDDDDL